MKLTSHLKKVAFLLAASSVVLFHQASGAIINIGVGQPGNSGDATILSWLNSSITAYNTANNPDLPAASAALGNFKNNQGENNGPSSSYPVFGKDVTSLTLPVGNFNYLALHWGGPDGGNTPGYQAFYIGDPGPGVTSFTFTNGDKHGLSWYAMFNPTTPPTDPGDPRVPDGGTTLLSLGVALLGLGSMRKLLATKA